MYLPISYHSLIDSFSFVYQHLQLMNHFRILFAWMDEYRFRKKIIVISSFNTFNLILIMLIYLFGKKNKWFLHHFLC